MARLTIHLDGLRTLNGAVRCMLFNRDDEFLVTSEHALTHAVRPSDCCKFIEYPEVPAGRWAAALWHDENDNGILEHGVFGIPTEGFGFSNNPDVRLNKPTFELCAFEVGEADTEITVGLNYLLY